jgi:hypothetical protein
MELQKIKKLDKNGQWRGGGREGAGRKAFDQDFEDRLLLTMWVCNWYKRKLSEKRGEIQTDIDCEDAVNGTISESVPVFKNFDTSRGKRWGEARKGVRAFTLEKLKAVCKSASHPAVNIVPKTVSFDKRMAGIEGDEMTIFMLKMLALDGIDGFEKEKNAKKQFTKLKTQLEDTLFFLSVATEEEFAAKKSEALKALQNWKKFSDHLNVAPKEDEEKISVKKSEALEALEALKRWKKEKLATQIQVGSISIKNEILDSFDDIENDYRYWTLRPTRSIKLISGFVYGGDPHWINLTLMQVSVTNFQSYFQNKRSALRHAKKVIETNSDSPKIHYPRKPLPVTIQPTPENPFADIDDLLSTTAS